MIAVIDHLPVTESPPPVWVDHREEQLSDLVEVGVAASLGGDITLPITNPANYQLPASLGGNINLTIGKYLQTRSLGARLLGSGH